MTTPETPQPDRPREPATDPAVEPAAVEPAVPATAGATPDDASTSAERRVLRTAMRDTLLLLGALLVLGVGVGLLVAGSAGMWGALVGVGLAAFFCATTIWSMQATVGSSPARMAAFVMGAWIVKVVVLVVVLALIQDATFYDPWVLLVVLGLGAIGSALLDYRAVSTGRVPYVQP
ncbi:hypothetical protein LEP48_10775 [Isoptericola sp. NEAU-Y5]|uniref:ATP synthase protein I n=1 Tax=Isoptericola luteus TaxID=2879484 RepID=A0ABS7ZFN7_9MICO|nr:hypothetical protein [Isoptericola sp. NEAU-Y5]MCA5893831.1 hypothetical protein [Isoptericola sp. NEAU-Y5]